MSPHRLIKILEFFFSLDDLKFDYVSGTLWTFLVRPFYFKSSMKTTFSKSLENGQFGWLLTFLVSLWLVILTWPTDQSFEELFLVAGTTGSCFGNQPLCNQNWLHCKLYVIQGSIRFWIHNLWYRSVACLLIALQSH